MKTRVVLFLVFCLSAVTVNAQTSEAIKVPAEVQAFIEKDSKAIALESADLNGDGLQDYILVIERPELTAAKYGYDVQQRPLLILVRNNENKLSEVKRNEQIVYCSDCGGVMGDPFMGVTVGKNTFTVNHYGGSAWRWELSYKFNYSRIDKTWQLVRIEKTSYHNVRPMKETLEKTVLTPPKDFGKVDIAEFDPAKFEKTADDENTGSFENIDVNDFNRQIEEAANAKENWVKMPTQVIAKMIGRFSEIRSRTIEISAPSAEEAESLTVTVIDDGFLDDSVRGEKHKFELKTNEQGIWKFVSAGKSWRCWEGRGHQDFSTSKCL
jgi:hypothetical protein